MKNYNYTIDLIRFVAACAVGLYHFNERFSGTDTFYTNVVKYGGLGVPVFFVISGYCILLSAVNSKNSTDFFIRRIFRIFPAFWFSLGVVLFVVLLQVFFLGQNSVAVLPKTPIDILKTVALLTKPFGETPVINWVYWSLTVELFFYIVVYMGLVLTRNMLLFVLIITILSLVLPHQSLMLFWIPHWFCFSLGSAIFFFRSRKNPALIATLVFANLVGLYKYHYILKLPYIITAFIAVLVVFVSFNYQQKESKLTKFGELSYAVYLLHVPIGVYIFGYFKPNIVLQSSFYNFGLDLISLIIVCGCSYLVYKYIEAPCIKIGKNLSKRLTK